jgi:hypothetical protein
LPIGHIEPGDDAGRRTPMLKFIGIIVAILPVVLFLRAIFFSRTSKRSQAVSEFRKQLDFAVSAILFFIGCAVVYALAKVIFQF